MSTWVCKTCDADNHVCGCKDYKHLYEKSELELQKAREEIIMLKFALKNVTRRGNKEDIDLAEKLLTPPPQ